METGGDMGAMLAYQVVHFIAGLSFLVALFVLSRDPRSCLYRAFTGMSGCVSLFSLGAWLRSLAGPGNIGQAQAGTLLMQIGLVLICPMTLLFTECFVAPAPRLLRISRWCALGGGPFLLAGSMSDYAFSTSTIVTVGYAPSWGWQAIRYGPMGVLLAVVVLLSMLLSSASVIASYRRASGLRRVQIQIYSTGFCIAVMMGAAAIFLRYYVLATAGFMICYMLIAYAITRYQFLDIQVIVRLGTVYITVSAILMGLYAVVVAAGTTLFRPFVPPGSLAFPLVGIAAVAILFDPLRTRVQRLLDRAFFRQNLDIQAALAAFAPAASRVTRAADLSRLLAESMAPALQPAFVRVYVLGDPLDRPAAREHQPLRMTGAESSRTLPATDPLVAWCRAERTPCVREERMEALEREERRGSAAGAERERELLRRLDEEGGDAILPLQRESDLLGLLVLGPKRAQIPYRQGEIDFASTLAAQSALALQNIWLNEAARSMEKDLHEADKFAALGALASEIAHEVRNPLSVVKTYVKLLPEKGRDADFLERFQTRVSPELDRVEGILDSVLQGASGRRRAFGEVHLPAIAEAALDFFAEDFARRRVVTEKEWNGHVPSLMGDAGQIRQVFQNLILNAVQAMPEGGRLRVRIVPAGDAIRVEVSDNGPGIPPEQIPNLFRPFSTTKPTGTGLGLAISRRIVQEHGGSIRVESSPGAGTTFILDFPLEKR